MSDKKEPNINSQHRSRQKKKFLENGLDGFQQHEILEAMLFYSIPQADTKPIAKALLKEFGTLKGVFEADVSDLQKVKGVGEHTASMIHFFRLLSAEYIKMTCSQGAQMNNSKEVLRYAKADFLGIDHEQVRILCLDQKLKLLKDVLINDGGIGQVEINARKIAESAFQAKCDRIILLHNHPKSNCMPSRGDIAATRTIASSLSVIGIGIIDHIIVGMDGEYSMRESDILTDVLK